MYPTIYQKLACIGGIVIDREVEMFPKNMKNSPTEQVLNRTMEELQGFMANKVDRIQGGYVPNDIPRAGMHRWDRH